MNYITLFVLVMTAVIVGCAANALMNFIVQLLIVGVKKLLKR